MSVEHPLDWRGETAHACGDVHAFVERRLPFPKIADRMTVFALVVGTTAGLATPSWATRTAGRCVVAARVATGV